ILEPGRIWDERSDHGMSRVALPFTLEERNANCMHNGMMTFLFDGRRVSNVAFEIASETCLYFKFDAWGQLAATFTPATAPDPATAAAYTLEVSHRLPVKPIAELARD